MITTFYLLSFLFIWMHLYYVININNLEIRFSKTPGHIKKVSKVKIFYYFTRILYWIWIGFGLVMDYHYFLWFIVGFSILKFILYHINNQLYKIWNLLVIPLSISVIVTIFFYWLV